MKNIFNKSILLVISLALLAGVLHMTTWPDRSSSSSEKYLMGRTTISYGTPPACTTPVQITRFIYRNC